MHKELLVAAKVPGASDMQTFRFFTNDFDTTTDGIDVVATYSTEIGDGVTDFTFVYNETETEVDSSKLTERFKNSCFGSITT